MDQSEVKRFVERDIAGLMEAMGVPHWNLLVEYGPMESNTAGFSCHGQCTPSVCYNKATIQLDPAMIQDEKALGKLLVHEIGHILISPFNLYRKHAASFIQAGSPQDSQEDTVWEYCMEQTIINLERMYRGLHRPTPDPGEIPVAESKKKPQKSKPKAAPKSDAKMPAKPKSKGGGKGC